MDYELWFHSYKENYVAIIVNDLGVYLIMWMNFANIIMSDRSQTQKGTYYTMAFIRTTGTSKANGIWAA